MKTFQSFTITSHALEQMKARGIAKSLIDKVMVNPDQIVKNDKHVSIYQSLIENSYLLRIFVNTGTQPMKVITCYKTSKISKYWISEG